MRESKDGVRVLRCRIPIRAESEIETAGDLFIMSELETFDEAISLVKFVRTCIADKIMGAIRNPQGGLVEVEQDQLFIWRKLLNQALQVIEKPGKA